jgi:hypothetical protein
MFASRLATTCLPLLLDRCEVQSEDVLHLALETLKGQFTAEEC